MKKNQKKPEFESQELNEETGWSFNNEIVLTLKELELLKNARERVEQQSLALQERVEAINAIKKFINRSK